MLVTGELWPSQRILAAEVGKPVPGETQMQGVEHLGQYVFEMTNAKVQQLRAERGLPEAELSSAPMEDIQEEEAYFEGDHAAIEEELGDGFEAEELE
jgi:intron-binding protein aquarius